MQWTGLNELREKFLDFFESKGHLKLPSFSLIPKDDNSLLLINSGMAPMKKYFTDEITPPKTRVTTCQKCIRTPDIERVGITARHGTFFEMLGNFSFGDYFKEEIIAWAWEFVTEVLKLPKEKLYISIYENDNESFDIWTKKVDVTPSHIVRLGKEDNFWEHGAGPCGPCSELYYDRGEEYGCGNKNCTVGCDCDRYMEFWNLVFTQFNNDGNGNYTQLEKKNIDTGMGLERLACIMQGVDNLFLVDTVQNIMNHVSKIANIKYGQNHKSDVSLRVITDHIRSTTFMIADGVMPSNEGRGYVLRRLLRRAARHGRLLGINKPFLSEVCKTVIKENEKAYPELQEKQDFIVKLIKTEEENFSRTIDQGLELLNNIIKKSSSNILSGEEAFKLNDTFGFPLDLTKEILNEKGMKVDEDRFYELMREQKNKARNARINSGKDAWAANLSSAHYIKPTEFIGYDSLESDSKILNILDENKNEIESVTLGQKATVILNKTPFYAVSGGQVGDIGYIQTQSGVIKIEDTIKTPSSIYMHIGTVTSGKIFTNEVAKTRVCSEYRSSVTKNHTAAHLLQSALRKVLGTHVEQAGQLVNDKYLRFDFTHFSALTNEEIKNVESLVNEQILKSIDVIVKEMPIEDAKKLGAMALFGEKYGDIVRVVKVDDFSIEFCGGTHVKNTSQIGLFKIISEASVASGVRRIEAVTGIGVLNLLNKYTVITNKCVDILKVNKIDDIPSGCSQLIENNKNKDRNITKLNSELANLKVSDLITNAQELNGIKVINKKMLGMQIDTLKYMCDTIKEKLDDFIAVFACINDNKSNFMVCIGEKAIQKGLNAGKIVKSIAQLTGGNGGGKPDLAMAGIKDLSKIDYALSQTENIIKENLK